MPCGARQTASLLCTRRLVHFHSGWCVTMRHEASPVRASAHGRRARCPEGGLALVRRLHPSSQPDLAGQCSWRDPACHCPAAGVRLPAGPQHHPGLQRARHGGPAGAQPPQPHHPHHLRRGWSRATPGAGPSQPAGLRVSHQCLDARSVSRRERPPGIDAIPGERRDHSAGNQAVGHRLEAGEALDHQSRPGIHSKKRRCDWLIRLAARHPDWVLGFGDETWWTRVKQPSLHTWSDEPVRLVEQSVAKDDPDPKALACYGLLLSETNELWLRFVDGRPVSAITIPFLADCCARLSARGKTALVLVWDNASWHISKAVKGWIRAYNRQVKQEGRGVRILACQLPVKAPWLNPIEPKWVHGKRAVVEPARLLTGAELEERVCAYFGCHRQEHLIAQQAA